ncbi:MAG: FAD-binding protein [Theionarchaea archaeon]|nr:FAD-binding protein [Theionarchaea archaeon]
MNPVARQVTYDIVIIGGGGAGAQAALSITGHSGDVTVAVVDKGMFGKAGCTILGEFSCNAALPYKGSKDSPLIHFTDTVREGKYINDQRLVEIYTEKAPERVEELQRLGPVFEEEDGKIKQDMVPGHSFPRAAYNNLHTGKSMMTTLKREVLKRDIDVFEECVIFQLLGDNQVCGALGYDMKSGCFIHFVCKAVIITTGGCGQLYKNSTNAQGTTGDGLALAYNAGAELQDMEFVQFFPTAQCYPRLLKLNPCFPSMLRYKGGCRLYNNEGTEFMKEKMVDWRFKATRDVISKAIYTEIKEGRGSPHGGVFMDVLHLPEDDIVETFSFAHMFENLLKMGIDLRKDSIETTVSAHFLMGGIKVNEHFSTCVDGLFAAGEAIAGIHGANRLPGNALSEILVTGHEAGLHAVEYVKTCKGCKRGKIDIEWILQLMERKNGKSPVALKKKIQEIMWEYVGVIRDGPGLKRALKGFENIKCDLETMSVSTKTLIWNKELVDALEAGFMYTVAVLIANAADYRLESRGSHFRSDYPETDKNWLVNIILEKGEIKTRNPRVTRIDMEGLHG